MSLDGVFFDADSMDRWFNPYDTPERQEYIQESIIACSAILFGRKIYEMLAPYWSSLHHNEMGIAASLPLYRGKAVPFGRGPAALSARRALNNPLPR